MRRGWAILAILALASILVFAAGCRAAAPKAADAPRDAAIGEPAPVEGSQRLPDDFPADVPLYANVAIQTVMSDEVAGGKAYLVGMESADDAGRIRLWYEKALADNGWRIASSTDVAEGVGGVNAEKGDRKVNVAIGYDAAKKAMISLTVVPKL